VNKYNEIIGLNDYFQPAYDLTNEVGSYWKQFIPNEKFFAVLTSVLSSLEGHRADEKKSLWLQGNYGTGKSHAVAVVKHLLFDEPNEIQEFVENFEDAQLKSRILNFRNKFRVFPAVLKGLSNVSDNRTFSLVIETAIKDALRKNRIEVSTKSDFERMIYQIESNPAHIDWDEVIKGYTQLSMYVKNKEELIKKLKNNDLDMFRNVETLSSEIGIHFSHFKIEQWLTEVMDELKSQKKADALMIYWDEFTSVLQRPNSGMLLTELQHIAELSVNKGIYLFVVTHKTLQQTEMSVLKDDKEKALGRFQILDYSMEPITTYHIMGTAIKKKDKEKWESLRDEEIQKVDNLIRRIIGTDSGPRYYNLLKNLFPIHPYTAYLSTFIVRNIGSTERSIFNFLYDKEKGFSKFINENPVNPGGFFLTADYLWDFFMSEFERVDYQKFSSVLDKYKLHIKSVKEEDYAYSVVFKGVLLLNVLHKMVNVAEGKEMLLVAPSIENIKSMFSGTEYESSADAALEFLDTKQILSKKPDNLFLVMSSTLPPKEVLKLKDELKNNYSQIDKILSKDNIKEIESSFTSAILRESELKIFDASLNEHLVKNKLIKAFKFDYSLHIALLIAQNVQDLEQIRQTVQNISQHNEITNIIFLIFDTVFDETVFDKFIEYSARAVVAERHSFKEEQVSNEDYAKKILEHWVNETTKTGYITWYLGEDKGKILISDFGNIVNDSLSAKIFYSGLEKLREVKKNKNVWGGGMARVCAENFLFANNRDFVESRTPAVPNKITREIIKNDVGEYIVDEQLAFKNGVDLNHPIIMMSNEIKKIIEKKNNAGIFHLGESLKFLTQPPFGIYKNRIHFATIGFLMRNYVGKLYESGKGKPIEKEMMRDKIVSLFNYWHDGKDSNKLEVRLGTKEEKTLINELIYIFSLKNIESLNDVKWGIRNWIKQSEYPLWVFKLSENSSDEINLAIDKIIDLIESRDQEITQSDIKSLLNIVNIVEVDLRILLQKERSHELFVLWVTGIDNVEVKGEDVDSAINYIRQHMPEEIGVDSWKEDNVREKTKDWYIAKSRLQPENLPAQKLTPTVSNYGGSPLPNDSGGGRVIEKLDSPGYKKLGLSVIDKIEKFNGDWKDVLKKIVAEHPEISNILEKYL